MKIVYEMHSSMTDSAQELSETVTKTIQELTGGKEEITIGVKIGEVVVEFQGDFEEEKFIKKYDETINRLWKEKGLGGKVWLIKKK